MWVKHENHQPVGAFKVRGGVNLVSQLTAAEQRRGALEILEARPDTEVIVVPIGGGSGAQLAELWPRGGA